MNSLTNMRARRAASGMSTQAETPGARMEVLELDLADLTGVQRLIDEWPERSRRWPPLRAVIADAGGDSIRSPHARTAQGFEATFGVNHIGHVAQVSDLLPNLITPARIVIVVSGTHDSPQSGGYPAPYDASARALAFPNRSVQAPEPDWRAGMARAGRDRQCLRPWPDARNRAHPWVRRPGAVAVGPRAACAGLVAARLCEPARPFGGTPGATRDRTRIRGGHGYVFRAGWSAHCSSDREGVCPRAGFGDGAGAVVGNAGPAAGGGLCGAISTDSKPAWWSGRTGAASTLNSRAKFAVEKLKTSHH